ncbi:hypothetical protein CXB51_003093 [Gossypium anomalum]|uniref:Pyruvate kinase n=1 Tax=Gossypium anomalum TaxID=47600 RepID=A0A8J5ZL01_9ROSI|nr:hypothetical protein CXB51_003093 [Gossypium anomalum]
MASILEPSKDVKFFPAMTKIVGTLGPNSRSVGVISSCLKVGMSDMVMLDIAGPELQVVNKSGQAILLKEDATVVLTSDEGLEASSELLPINFDGLPNSEEIVFAGDSLVTEVNGNNVVFLIKNSATLTGSLFTLYASQMCLDLPTLSDKDKKYLLQFISTWGVQNKIDFLSLSFTRHAEDVRHARKFLSKLGDLYQTQIFAKIEKVEGLNQFDKILKEADGIILSRGNLGIDLPPEKFSLNSEPTVILLIL